jgi:hypothetical protein
MFVATNRRREHRSGSMRRAGSAQNGASPMHGAVFAAAHAVGNLFAARAPISFACVAPVAQKIPKGTDLAFEGFHVFVVLAAASPGILGYKPR